MKLLEASRSSHPVSVGKSSVIRRKVMVAESSGKPHSPFSHTPEQDPWRVHALPFSSAVAHSGCGVGGAEVGAAGSSITYARRLGEPAPGLLIRSGDAESVIMAVTASQDRVGSLPR